MMNKYCDFPGCLSQTKQAVLLANGQTKGYCRKHIPSLKKLGIFRKAVQTNKQ
jgi:hypothetical protein